MIPDIHRAAREGDLQLLCQLLDQGIPVDSYNHQGYTPLMVACVSPRAGTEILEFLIDRGADLHACVRYTPPTPIDPGDFLDDENLDPEMREMLEKARRLTANFTPDNQPVIAFAVGEAEIGKIRLLIERGADAYFISKSGYSLAITAANHARGDVLEFLASKGAPLDGRSSHNESALSVLSRQGRYDLVAWLLDQGVDPSPLGWNALMKATAIGSLAEVQAELKDADLESRDYWERTALLIAVMTGDTAKADLLLHHGANLEARGRCNVTALHLAVQNDLAPMAAWLIGRGLSPTLRN